jgi:hypothetical protein
VVKKMNIKNKSERELVRKYVKRFVNCYVFVDSDSPARLHKSGFDFLVSHNGKVSFFEAKQIVKRGGAFVDSDFNFMALLSDYQKLTRLKIVRSECEYFILLFVQDAQSQLVNCFRYNTTTKEIVFDGSI